MSISVQVNVVSSIRIIRRQRTLIAPWKVQLQRQLTFQITSAIYGLNDPLSYSRNRVFISHFASCF